MDDESRESADEGNIVDSGRGKCISLISWCS